MPFCVLAALVPGVTGLAVVFFGVLLAAAAIDAALARAHMRGVCVSIPDVVRMSRSREANIPVTIHNEKMLALEMNIGLPLPAAVGSVSDTITVSVRKGCLESSITWPCKPGTRGSFAVNRCYFEVRSPYGFWNSRGATDCRSEVRVYPDLISERKGLAALFLNRGQFGLH